MTIYSELGERARRSYEECIAKVASLSRLFSDNLYLNSKAMERIYCRCLPADNVALDNIPIDAKLHLDGGEHGIGLKTFGVRGESRVKTEKIAEFDRLRGSYTGDIGEDLSLILSAWNERLDEAVSVYGVDDFTYHYLTRSGDVISVNECGFGALSDDGVVPRPTVSGFAFNVKGEGYSFNYPKSVLYKTFDVAHPIGNFKVDVLEDPLSALGSAPEISKDSTEPVRQQLTLPLFGRLHGTPYVFEKSGLNQWNAGGRRRSYSEVYIPYNKEAKERSVGFFPEYVPGQRGSKKHFTVRLPNGREVEASLCQQGGKGIMSSDNSDFGEWLLFDVLGMKEGEIVTMERLESRGINSVVFTKTGDMEYSLDFTYVAPEGE